MLGKAIKVISKILNIKLDEEIINKEQLFSKEVKAKYPILPTLILPGDVMIFEPTAIARHLARNTPLYNGKDELGMIDSWMELFKSEIFVKAYNGVIFPILGHKSYTNKSYADSLQSFKSFLPRINKISGEFLVGTSMSIADIYGAALMHLPFALLVDEGMRKNFGKLNGWFNKVANDPVFVEVFGIPRFCKVSFKPLLPPSGEEVEEKKEKKEQKKEQKKEKKEKKEEKKEEATAEKEQDQEQEEDKPVKKNPLDLLPPSSLDIDDFKRKFLANKTAEKRREYIKTQFFTKFDPEGWGLWYCDYIKAEGEGQVLLQTSNLLGGFLYVTL